MVPKSKTHNQKSKIALLVPSFPKLSETFIVSKFLGLLEKGWDVHIMCGNSQKSEWAHFPELNQNHVRQRVHVTWPHRPRWLAALLFPLALLRSLLLAPRSMLHYLSRGWSRFGPDILRRFYLDAALIRLQPDIIHFEFGTLAVGRTYLKDLLDTRLTVSFRGYDLNYVGLETPGYYQEVWDKVDALHLLGEDLWRRAIKRGFRPDKLHTLIPPAIDTNFFSPSKRAIPELVGVSKRPLRILSVARLNWKKGYEYALQAVKILVDQGIVCEYRIIGSGDYLESIAFARHQLGLENVVQILGAHTREEVRAQMEWADVFLHAAVSEGFCNAVMEAQAMALPVVCTDADGLPENVSDGETGFIVPRRDPQALAEKLGVLAASARMRESMMKAGRERVLALFRLEDQVGAFEAMFFGVKETRKK